MKAIECKTMQDIAEDGVSFVDADFNNNEEGSIIFNIKFLSKKDIQIIEDSGVELFTTEDALKTNMLGNFIIKVTSTGGFLLVNKSEALVLSTIKLDTLNLVMGMVENFKQFLLDNKTEGMLESVEFILGLLTNLKKHLELKFLMDMVCNKISN